MEYWNLEIVPPFGQTDAIMYRVGPHHLKTDGRFVEIWADWTWID